MEKEYVMYVAQTIGEQLLSLTPAPVIMSWGIEEFAVTMYRGLPALRIKVNGRLHTGYVIVALHSTAPTITRCTSRKTRQWSVLTGRYASTSWEMLSTEPSKKVPTKPSTTGSATGNATCYLADNTTDKPPPTVRTALTAQ